MVLPPERVFGYDAVGEFLMINILMFVAGGLSGLLIAWLLEPLFSGFIAGLAGDDSPKNSAEP